MAQKIKVQDGNIVYAASDPASDVNFGINGLLNVTKEVHVGNNPATPGIITTSVDPATNIGQNLNITTGSGIGGSGNLNIHPTGALLLNGVQWPNGLTSATPGSYVGASGLNTLEYYSFIFAIAGSDTLTDTQLNALYPTIQPGQSVIGPTVVYQCISAGQWRSVGAPLGYTPVNKAGDTMIGYLILNGNPVDDLGAVTKQYVDQLATGINIQGAVETSTVSPLSLCTYTNGVSGGGFDPGGRGVGATLISVSHEYIDTAGIGGYNTLTVGSRILVKDQAVAIQNGIYTVTDLGANDPGGRSWVLTRALDYNNSQPNQVHAGAVAYVQEGTLAGTQWVQTSIGTGPSDTTVIGTNNIIFTQFSGAGTFTGGNGISVAGNVITNTGVLSNAAGTGISVSSGTGNNTITNTGVISAISGTGISVSSGTGNVTVSNTGVLSFNSRSGSVSLTSLDVTNALGYIPGTGGGSVSSINVSGGTTGLTTSGGPVVTSGTITLSGTLGVANGGTGQTTSNSAFNALAPNQAGNAGKFLTTDGSNTSWANTVQTSNGSVAAGTGSLPTNATSGFFYIPTCAGVPTGIPTAIAGFAPMVIDSTDNRLYVYVGGSWLAINVAVYS